jgi:hypothetical protein
MNLDNPTLLFLFVTSIALGGLIGRAHGGDLVGQRLRNLRHTTDQMKRRWWSTFWSMIRLVEKKEAEDRGDYWKTGEPPPWYA